jgi:hypothetical protein
MALLSSSGEPNLLGPIDRASLYRSTETLWLQNIETIDKVQRINRINFLVIQIYPKGNYVQN